MSCTPESRLDFFFFIFVLDYFTDCPLFSVVSTSHTGAVCQIFAHIPPKTMCNDSISWSNWIETIVRIDCNDDGDDGQRRKTHSIASSIRNDSFRKQKFKKRIHTRALTRKATTKHMQLLQTLNIDCLPCASHNGIECYGLSCENISSSRRLVSYVRRGRAITVSLDANSCHSLRIHFIRRHLAAMLLFSSRSFFIRIVSFRSSCFLVAFALSALFGRLKQMLRLNVGIK